MRRAAAEQSFGGSFLEELVRELRVDEGYTTAVTDFELLGPLVGRSAARAAMDTDSDPDVFWRIERFHAAVGAAIERRTGVRCIPLMKMHDGSGWVVLLAGRLVVMSRWLRDVRRFGFETIEALAQAGERLVSEGAEMIERYPEVARSGQ